MSDDAMFYLLLGFVMTVVFIGGIILGAVANWYLGPSAPVLSNDDVKFLTTRLSDQQLAENNRAYKEFAKRSEAEL